MDTATPVQRSQRSARRLDRKKAIELQQQGLGNTDIAKHQGVAVSTVYRFLSRLDTEKQHIERFKANRADYFADLQVKALHIQHLLVDELAKDGVVSALDGKAKCMLADSMNRVVGTSFDKERLERGESTQNISTLSRLIRGRVGDLHKRIKQG